MPSLRMMLVRWVSTVFTLMSRREAIRLLLFPLQQLWRDDELHQPVVAEPFQAAAASGGDLGRRRLTLGENR